MLFLNKIQKIEKYDWNTANLQITTQLRQFQLILKE